jgi:hypothetical protein
MKAAAATRCAVLAASCVLSVVSGCGDTEGPAADPDGRSSSSTTASTSPSSTTRGPSTGSSGDADTTGSTGATSTTASTDAQGSDAAGEEMSFEELFARRQDLVGDTVEVEGKVFFDTNCPPPGSQSAPCILNGYLADPSLTTFSSAATEMALPLSEGGAVVSCSVGTSPGSGCPGWEHGRRYRVVAEVQHRISGGRETDQVELAVKDKTAI